MELPQVERLSQSALYSTTSSHAMNEIRYAICTDAEVVDE